MNAPTDATGRIERLAADVRRHRQLYYNETPEISDAEFDALVDRLEALAPDHPALAEVGAPVTVTEGTAPPATAVAGASVDALAAQVRATSDGYYDGAEPTTKQEKVYAADWRGLLAAAPDHRALMMSVTPRGEDWPKARHDIPMGSLNKVNTPDELRAWLERCDGLAEAAEVPPMSGDLAMTEKLDGISLEVLYDGGQLEQAITRGDGQLGERITANVLRMRGVPAKIAHHGRLSVRGEIVLRKSDAAAMSELKAAIDKNFDPKISLRNTAAGAARAKTPRFLPATRFLSVLFYDIEGAEGLGTERAKIELITELGFTTPSMMFGDAETILERFAAYAGGLRGALDYEIDGLVIRANQIQTFAALGDLNNRPRAAVALKFGNEMAVSTVRQILWETGPSGRITPVAVVDPVRLVGAEVRRASLHNIGHVRKLGIGVGDEVLVSRRNDVIPYVEKVEVKGDTVEEAPANCAVCQAPVAIDGEYIVCRNPTCTARLVGRLKTWIRELGLLEWGDRTFETFHELGLLDEPADFYRLTVEGVAALNGFGDIRAHKLIDPLRARMQIPIATFIAALGIPTVSKETAKLLVEAGYDTIDAIAGATVEQLAEIPGLGTIKAEKIIAGISARLDEVERLAAVGVTPTKPADGGPLAGSSFCFSGSHSRPRKVLQAIVDRNGGKVTSGVTKGLDYLVLADPTSTSSKAQKARGLGTEVIDEATFDSIVSARGGTLEP